MSSNEVLEANVAAIHLALDELRSDFRDAVARIDNDIKSAISRLESEIVATGARAGRDLGSFESWANARMAEMRLDVREIRADNRALRERLGENYETLSGRISAAKIRNEQ